MHTNLTDAQRATQTDAINDSNVKVTGDLWYGPVTTADAILKVVNTEDTPSWAQQCAKRVRFLPMVPASCYPTAALVIHASDAVEIHLRCLNIA